MAEEMAEHSCIFRCLLESTNMGKVTHIEAGSSYKTAHSPSLFLLHQLQAESEGNSEDSTAKDAAGLRGYWGLLTPSFKPYRSRQTTGMTRDKTAIQTL